MQEKKPLIVLAGPTAVGKTNLSIKLAKAIDGEIISADSMQVYKGMDIGTAKIMPSEMENIPHHMIDILEPHEEFNVNVFKEHSSRCINEIHSRGRIPVLTGGTGFYIQAVLNDIEFTEHAEDSELRARLQEYAAENGVMKLHARLSEKDEEAAAGIHPNNVKRVIRALAYCIQTSEKFSDYNRRETLRESPYAYHYFVLTMDREKLYDRIEQRIDTMLSNGLVNEVKSLVAKGCSSNMVSMQGLGYKEIINYLNNNCTYEEAVETIKKETRHFAKRQLTWFRREKNVIWLDKTNKSDDEVLAEIYEIIKQQNNISH